MTTPEHDDRRRGFTTAEQLAALAPLLLVWAVGVGVLALAMLRAPEGRVALFLDATATSGLPWFTGVYAELSAIGWAVAAVSAGLASFVVRLAGRGQAARFLLGGAAVTGLHLVDAVVQLHSRVLPKATPVPKQGWLVLFALVTVGWAAWHRGELRRTRWQVLAAGGLAMVGAVGVDLLLRPTDGLALLVEDATKFLGILAVATYFVLTTRDVVRSVVRRSTGWSPTVPDSPAGLVPDGASGRHPRAGVDTAPSLLGPAGRSGEPDPRDRPVTPTTGDRPAPTPG